MVQTSASNTLSLVSLGGSVTKMIEAKWAVELEHSGQGSPDYFSVDSLMLDGDGIHIQVADDGPAIEFSRDSIRKLLIMRVKDAENESVPEDLRAGRSV